MVITRGRHHLNNITDFGSKQMKKLLAGIFLILSSSGFLFFKAQPDGLLHVYFLNVGQGDSALIRTPGGKNILIDGGPDNKVLSELGEVLPLWGNAIDYAILSHPDQDHIEGLVNVLKNYPVKHVIFAGGYKGDYYFDTFLKIIIAKNIQPIIADENSDVTLDDGVKIDVLFPFSAQLGQKIALKNFSVIVKIIYGENEILFPGDAEADEEKILLDAGVNLDADILKIGHHGSKTSTSDPFLQAVSPNYGIISVGQGNKFHHPHSSTLKKLAAFGSKFLRTDTVGRIEMTFSQDKVVEITTSK